MSLFTEKFSDYVRGLAKGSPTEGDLLPAVLGGAAASADAKSLKGKTVYVSQMAGVVGDANLSNVTLGTDDTAAIQAGMNAAPAGSTFVFDGKFKVRSLAVPNGSEVRGYGGRYDPVNNTYPATGLCQATGGPAGEFGN